MNPLPDSPLTLSASLATQQLLAAETAAARLWQRFLQAPFALREVAREDYRKAEEHCRALREQLARTIRPPA